MRSPTKQRKDYIVTLKTRKEILVTSKEDLDFLKESRADEIFDVKELKTDYN